jgi:anti-sigma factor RsiW
MNCEHCQNLLPAFLDGELSSGDDAALNAHLAGCESCREALAGYRALEDVLVARRDEVPAADGFIRGVFTAPAADADAPAVRAAVSRAVSPALRTVSPAFHRARVIMDAIFSVPGLAAVFSVIIGAMCFHYRAVISSWINHASASTPSTAGASLWFNQALTTYAGDMTQVFIVYGVATALIAVTGYWATMRFIREQ